MHLQRLNIGGIYVGTCGFLESDNVTEGTWIVILDSESVEFAPGSDMEAHPGPPISVMSPHEVSDEFTSFVEKISIKLSMELVIHPMVFSYYC